MGVLADYLKSEVDQLRAEVARRREDLDEWLDSINKLYDLLVGWLAEADSGLGILGTNRHSTSIDLAEPRLGNYTAGIMWVSLGGPLGNRNARIEPRARYVGAVIHPPGREPRRADGMVHIKEQATPAYYLFRWKEEAGDEWFIQNVDAWNAARDKEYGRVEPLDRERFEAAMLSVLQ